MFVTIIGYCFQTAKRKINLFLIFFVKKIGRHSNPPTHCPFHLFVDAAHPACQEKWCASFLPRVFHFDGVAVLVERHCAATSVFRVGHEIVDWTSVHCHVANLLLQLLLYLSYFHSLNQMLVNKERHYYHTCRLMLFCS